MIEIINGDHDPALPFMIVARFGMHVDFSGVQGQLFDPTVAKIEWGHKDQQGQIYGTVKLKNGTGRNFWDGDLMKPYLAVYNARKAELARTEA